VSPIATRHRRLPARDRAELASRFLLAALALLTLALMATLDHWPAFGPQLRVTNPTVYQVEIDVRGADGGGWLALGGFRRESSRIAYEVLDQGRSWVFRFTYGGISAGEVDLTRAQLQRDGWALTVPPEVADRLRAAGLPPSAH
jgi:hypothetical protein